MRDVGAPQFVGTPPLKHDWRAETLRRLPKPDRRAEDMVPAYWSEAHYSAAPVTQRLLPAVSDMVGLVGAAQRGDALDARSDALGMTLNARRASRSAKTSGRRSIEICGSPGRASGPDREGENSVNLSTRGLRKTRAERIGRGRIAARRALRARNDAVRARCGLGTTHGFVKRWPPQNKIVLNDPR